MQRLAGEGMVFLEFDGHVVEYDLQPGQQIIVDTGYLAAMEGTCSMDIQTVPGVKICFWREGIFNTVITGGTYMAPDYADLECSRSDLTVYSVKVLIRRIHSPDSTENLHILPVITVIFLCKY